MKQGGYTPLEWDNAGSSKNQPDDEENAKILGEGVATERLDFSKGVVLQLLPL